MTPKEKAHQLVKKYYVEVLYGSSADYSERMLRIFVIKAKNCALIAVDEILGFLSYESHIKYWQEVKIEIGAL
jgi:hypothetical protein